MAIDAWLLEQHRLGQQPSILRFYDWKPAAISLGYHQKHWPEAWGNVAWRGELMDLVRRPTGGRAVLHQGDLTSAIITSGLPGSRAQVYRHLCEFLIQGWHSLGVDLTYGQAGRGYIHNPNCFGTATVADLILANGFKLIGSAQLRRGNAILQHGSIRLNPDPELFCQVFGGKLNRQDWWSATEHFSTTYNRLISIVIEALHTSAADYLGAEFVIQPLIEQEIENVKKLMSNL